MDGIEIVADEWGLFSAAQAWQAGQSPAGLERLRRSGRIERVARGWYAVSPPGTQSPQRRHTVRALAAQRSLHVPTVLSHYSALASREVALYGPSLTTVHLTLVDGDHWPRSRGSVRLHSRWPQDLDEDAEMPIAAAIAQTGSVSGPLSALVAADSALRRSLVTRDELAEAAGLLRGRRHGAATAAFLARADGRAQSVGETRLRHLFQLAGFAVLPQFTITAPGFVAHCDLGIEGAWVVAEFDGRVKYGRQRDDVDGWPSGVDELFAEKRREDRIRDLGYEMVRYVWDDLARPRTCLERMHHAVARAGSRHRGVAG